MIIERIRNIDPSEFVVVDLDTGTVLGTNLVLVPAIVVNDETLDSDSAAIETGNTFGIPLLVDTADLPILE